MTESGLGPYGGEVAPACATPVLVGELRGLAALLERAAPDRRRRSRVTVLELACGRVAVKSFPPQGFVGSRLARRFGSKAGRSYRIARALQDAGVGTPEPIAFLERWERGRLVESHFVSRQIDKASSLHRELIHLFREEFQYRKVLDLLQAAVGAIRRMHDAGVLHGDLGNQNVLLVRTGESSWGDVAFLDLNRGKVRPGPLSERERAFDLSRLTLPSRLRRTVRQMYYPELYRAGRRPPRALERWERLYRWRFAVHTWTRGFRHPLRQWRLRRAGAKALSYPRWRDLWIWDEHTHQAIGLMTKWDKLRYVSLLSALRMGASTLSGLWAAWRGLARARERAFAAPVHLRGRIAMTVTPGPGRDARLEALLEPLGRLPLLVRFYRHEGPEAWDHAAAFVRRMHARGHPVAAALVQDRAAVRDPALWRAFVEHVFARVGDVIEAAEAGHAVNRVKWGIWSLRDYARLLRPLPELERRYPAVRWLGPAVNDFEYHYVRSALGCLPRGMAFDALGLHLYMDRHGAPEGSQRVLFGVRVSGLDKFLLPRVLASATRRCAGEAWVTEVNWPLGEEGGSSHEFAPYFWVGEPWLDRTANTEAYASFLVRYYLLAICSGAIGRVYWWKLAGQSFGLVDDRDPDPERWRERPAYAALKTLLEQVGEATFERRVPVAAGDAAFVLVFRRPDGRRVAVAWWAGEGRIECELPFTWRRAAGREGEPHDAAPPALRLDGRPVYLIGLDEPRATTGPEPE